LALPESITATIIPADAAPSRMASLARRRPTLYTPLLALHRSPIDGNATKTQRTVALAAVQWPDGPSLLESVRPAEGELMVLPELSALPSGLSAEQIKARAEPRDGAFETALANPAGGGKRRRARQGLPGGRLPRTGGSRFVTRRGPTGPRGQHPGGLLGRASLRAGGGLGGAWRPPVGRGNAGRS